MAARGGGGITRPPRSNRNDDPVPPPPTAAEAGSISTGLAGAEAGAPPSSPAEVRVVASHPDNEIATKMMEEKGGRSSATMVTADDDGGRGDRRPSRRRWRLEVILPSSALPPSRDDGDLRGAQKPVARRTNAVANAIAPEICTVAGAAASHGRKTKAEAETTSATTRTARTTPASAISRRQGGFNNQQGREVATEGSGVGADGRTMM